LQSRRSFVRSLVLSGLLALVAFDQPLLSIATPSSAHGADAAVTASVASLIQPEFPRDWKPQPRVSAAQIELGRQRVGEMRERLASRVQAGAGAGSLTPVPGAASREAPAAGTATGRGPLFHGTPSDFVIGRNVANPNATCTTGDCSTLAEPAAANEGRNVLYSGNLRHAEFSKNGGSTWTAFTFPAGPGDATIPFGDTDVIYDHSRGVAFHSILYVDNTSAPHNGVVRIFVRRKINLAANCSYTLDPSSTTNVLPDYPHIGLSDDFLYLGTNNVANGVGGTWSGAQMRRLNVDQMADCVTASTNVATFTGPVGQRIIVPGHGARDTMYWAWVENTTTWRVFTWPETTTTVTQTLRTVSSMTFGDPDCRGGTLNNDWANANEAGIVGFNVRTAIGGGKIAMFAATAADASHTQGHIHGAIFRQFDLALLSQPVVFLTDQCTGIPIVGANDRGDFGLVIAVGGRAGGGGSAAHPDAFMIDEFSPGPGGFSLSALVSGTHNRTDARYGDYFTVRRQAPCGEFFSATGYALSGGTAASNVAARYVEFGRRRDEQCYLAWRGKSPAT
jgi:hypothetical protein